MSAFSREFLDLQTALAGKYSLERELGRGGMGVVYLARDVQLDRDVAIKVLPSYLASREESRDRFLREARTAAGLSHPHIVPIHAVGEAGGFVFFVMSYVAGETLGERLRSRGPMAPAEATRILREVAWALAYAHGRGIVHRDVKPDNILLESGTGRALVTDFGIAQGGDRPVSDPGKIMGTAQFMSPEQACGEPLDGRSDLYALGVVGYLAVSGRLPFEAASVPALLAKLASEQAPRITRTAPGVPPMLGAAIDRCLQPLPVNRFADGEALADALAPAAEARPALPAPLRGWLRTENPAQGLYMAWTGLFSLGLATTVMKGLMSYGHPELGNTLILAGLAAAPMIPMVGFQIAHGRRLFRAGFTVADLRTALALAERERAEGESFAEEAQLPLAKRVLRAFTYAAMLAAALAPYATTSMMFSGIRKIWILGSPMGSAVVLFGICNVVGVPLMPSALRKLLRPGIREWLWGSWAGALLARRLGAPAVSRPLSARVFRPTESALGIAAADLYAALPKSYRDQLAELPATVTALEQRALEARAAVEAIDALARESGPEGERLVERREAARSALGSAVAALEGIRLDLLRLHAGNADLAPLTTLLDAARVLGDDLWRLADAQDEVAARRTPRRVGADRVPTPA